MGGGATAEAQDPRRPERWVFLVAGAIVVGLGWLYGFVPFSGHGFALPVSSSISGWDACLDEGHWRCTYVGYPEGVDLSISMPLVVGVHLLTEAGLSVEAATNVVALGALAGGFTALWWLAAAITRHVGAGLVGAAIYVASPLLVTHTDKLGLWLGLVLLPVPVALTYAALRASPQSRRQAAWLLGVAGLVLLSGVVMVYLDPYAWMIATLLCAPMCMVAGVAAGRRRAWAGLVVAGAAMVALLVPSIVFRLAEPSAEASAGFPLGFYRAMGADTVTALVPTSGSVLWDILRWPVHPWDPTRFRGDGTQLLGAYLGVTVVVAALVGAVRVLRRPELDRPIVAALVVAGAACLVLGFGPSLKALDRSPTRGPGAALYDMPAAEAKVSLPWSGIYGVQPFEGMRAAYRWHAGARVVLAILATAAVVMALRRRSTAGRPVGVALAAVVAALLTLDTTSHALVDARGTARRHHEAFRALIDDIDRELGEGQLAPSERVLFLPAKNDYLIMAIAPGLRVFAYNGAFDKELPRIRARQPRPVVAAIQAHAAGVLDSGQLCALFRQDLADAVVFTNFDMRVDTIGWPPDGARVDEWRERTRALGLFDDPAFDVLEQDLTTVVRPADTSVDGCSASAPATSPAA